MTSHDYRKMAADLEALGTDNYYVPAGGEVLKDAIASLRALADSLETQAQR